MRVYHLLSAEYALSDIALKRIRISRLRDLNDPFELLAANVADDRFRGALLQTRREVNEMSGVLCFSKAWSDPVLWSHYAQKHRGVCLGFDLADELAKDVEYITERIPVPFIDEGKTSLQPGFGNGLLRQKFATWKYEQEVRVIVELKMHRCEMGSYFHSFSEQLQLREVILGPLCELPTATVRELVDRNYESVSVFNATLAYKWFAVVPDGRPDDEIQKWKLWPDHP